MSKITQQTPDSSPTGDDYVVTVDSSSGRNRKVLLSDVLGYIEDSQNVHGPEGYMRNGYISRTVTSNNITVAIKTLAGNDPSSTDPVKIRIGNTERTITSALSLTVNAGTNWFNSGSSSLATYEIDYFTYLGWRASNSSMFIGFARIPYAITYGDFSTTSTNEKYLAYSGAAPASTDEVEVIGRFNATLSASASFNWSVPATSVIVNRPIFETRTLNYDIVLTGFSVLPVQRVDTYQINGRRCVISHNNGNGTSNSTSTGGTAPFAATNLTNDFHGTTLWSLTDNGVAQATPGRVYIAATSPSAIVIGRAINNDSWTASGSKGFRFMMEYPIA